ncbi:MAG TPA: LysM peptidoglycan-binding domain-containing protein [Cytophagales bacterium]|nr:LysM peptidoglycan-binding domain-containing protein [Cytophagales bacterium]
MIKKLLIYPAVLFNFVVMAQIPQVPSTMEFGGIELKIDKHGQELIQASVNSLTRHPPSFQVLVDRANIHFPLIEKILKEENVPEDFKYLVLQESALIPDAVSTSNAVGYWQFKKEAASDVNVLVNGQVDERMHIATATRGAAKYLKKNNTYLSNWLNALLSYNTGLGGVKILVDQSDINAKSMKITRTTHIYVLKFLSYKIAFENALRLTPSHYTLLEYKDCENKTLKEIANELDFDEEELSKYNVWLKAKRIPSDKDYSVVVPASQSNYEKLAALLGVEKPAYVAREVEVKTPDRQDHVAKLTSINNLKAIIAGMNDNVESLSKKAKISENKFLRYNELSKEDKVVAGQIYYFESKKNKAEQSFHVAEETDSYWSVSQKYGIKESRVRRFNRIGRNEKLQPGRVLWIAETRPALVPVEIKVTKMPSLASRQSEIKVITYPDKRRDLTEKKESNAEEVEMFPDEFYEEVKVSTVSSSSSSEVANEKQDTQAEIIPDAMTEKNFMTPSVHEVKKGETLYGISRQHGINVLELKQLNNLEGNEVKIGQRLVIKTENSSMPDGENLKKENYITYIVQSGDSIFRIAKLHNVTIKQLQDWNNKTDSNIAIGEKLKIYKN